MRLQLAGVLRCQGMQFSKNGSGRRRISIHSSPSYSLKIITLRTNLFYMQDEGPRWCQSLWAKWVFGWKSFCFYVGLFQGRLGRAGARTCSIFLVPQDRWFPGDAVVVVVQDSSLPVFTTTSVQKYSAKDTFFFFFFFFYLLYRPIDSTVLSLWWRDSISNAHPSGRDAARKEGKSICLYEKKKTARQLPSTTATPGLFFFFSSLNMPVTFPLWITSFNPVPKHLFLCCLFFFTFSLEMIRAHSRKSHAVTPSNWTLDSWHRSGIIKRNYKVQSGTNNARTRVTKEWATGNFAFLPVEPSRSFEWCNDEHARSLRHLTFKLATWWMRTWMRRSGSLNWSPKVGKHAYCLAINSNKWINQIPCQISSVKFIRTK